MECPNGHGEMEGNNAYVNVGNYGADVMVYICQECQFVEVRIG